MDGKKSKPPKRKFFRPEIRFSSRGEIELTFLEGLRRGVCDPVGFEMEYPDEEDEDVLASPVDEGSEGEVELAVEEGGGSGDERWPRTEECSSLWICIYILLFLPRFPTCLQCHQYSLYG